jgi:hypothetical protein
MNEKEFIFTMLDQVNLSEEKILFIIKIQKKVIV